MTDKGPSTTDTRRLVIDYLLYRLHREKLTWSNCPCLCSYTDLDPDPGRVERTMRTLGDEFQERYTQAFPEMCKQLDITPMNARHTFETTADQLFSEGIKWGRVVALFAFAGSLAVECVRNEMAFVVDELVQWTTDYIDSHLQLWIQQSGDWDGLVEFYEGRCPEQMEEWPWPSFSTLCGCAVGAIGVITLGAFFSQKS